MPANLLRDLRWIDGDGREPFERLSLHDESKRIPWGKKLHVPSAFSGRD
jgi:hypothetical protein